MNPDEWRVVIDTSVLVSSLLRWQSTPGKAVVLALRKTTVLVSENTVAELVNVLNKPKFLPYLTAERAENFVRSLTQIAEFIPVTTEVHVCRDPTDDKFLALAVSGKADIIITGDDDLLVLDPFQGVSIVPPNRFLDEHG